MARGDVRGPGESPAPKGRSEGPLAGPGGTMRIDAVPQGGAPGERGATAPITGVDKTVVRWWTGDISGIYRGLKVSSGNL